MRIELLVRGRVGVDRVQHAGVVRAAVALGELLVQRRGRRERHVLEIAGQADQHGAARLGVDAGHGHAVGPQSGPVLAGIAAHQQDVVAALLGLLVPAAGEHGSHQIALRRDHARGGDQTADHGEHQAQVEHGEAEPVPPRELRRAGDPPGVDRAAAPSRCPAAIRPNWTTRKRRSEREDGDRRAPPDQGEQSGQQRRRSTGPTQTRTAIRPSRRLPAAICADPGSSSVMPKKVRPRRNLIRSLRC